MSNLIDIATEDTLQQHEPASIHFEGILTNKQRKKLQHEFKIHTEKYFKDLLGKGSDFTKVTIWNNLVTIRGQGFLTEPEKFMATDPKGCKLVKESRLHIAKRLAADAAEYYEVKLGAKCIRQSFDIDSSKDFWMHVLFFDEILIDLK